MPYVKQTWVNSVTDADAAHMNHIEDGLAAADAAGLPPPVNGKWLTAVGGVPVWQDLPAAPVSGGALPGEIRMWSGSSLPSGFGAWVWADGAPYPVASYPVAAVNIAPGWRTHAGKADPGASFFRVPDLRGSAPVGMDAMPGGARANRTARAAAATLAAVAGEEYHSLLTAEMPSHGHGVSDPTHAHSVSDPTHAHSVYDPQHTHGQGAMADAPTGAGRHFPQGVGYNTGQNSELTVVGNVTGIGIYGAATGVSIYGAGTGVSIQNAGGGGAHENLQPTVFVPYICFLG